MPLEADVGRIRYIHDRLETWLNEVFTTYEYETFSVEEWDFDITRTQYFPIITVGVDNYAYMVEAYNRDTGSGRGQYVYMPFTLYVYDYKTTDPAYSEYYDVNVLSDRIIRYFRTKQRNPTEMDTYGINDVLDLDQEESQPRGVRRLARVIITGVIKSKRVDIP